jgi:glutamate dehydrogenase
MAVKAERLGSELIEAVCERAREELPGDDPALFEPFLRQYYRWVPPEDVRRRSEAELYGAALAHWKLARHRAQGDTNLSVVNPTLEREGWQSPRTVVQIVSDDMPFVVDSVTMELGREGHSIDLVIHPVILVRRDAEGSLIEVLERDAEAPDAVAESVFHAEVVREPDPERLEQLQAGIERVLKEVRGAVEGWRPMRDRMLELAAGLERGEDGAGETELEEAVAFLRWVAEDHFTFLGYRQYDLVADGAERGLSAVKGSGLGILRRPSTASFKPLRPKALELARSPHPLILTKANSKATVHRPAYLDYIGVKRYDQDGEVIGECRFLGLYTSTAYRASPREIPLLRGKVRAVLERAGFPHSSHDEKALIEILESYPRDALLQMGEDDLFGIAIGLLGLGERPWVRLFVWRDPLDRFVSCLVTVPRDRYNTDNRQRIERILMEAFSCTQLDYTLQLSESVLVRLNYVVRCADGVPDGYDVQEIEERLTRVTRAWADDLRVGLIEAHGEEQGVRLHRRYRDAFGPAYRSDTDVHTAVEDIGRLERITAGEDTIITLYRPRQPGGEALRCKLYSSAGVSLSDVLPTFEHMGAKVVDERPHRVQPQRADPVWIYDFGLRVTAEDVESVRQLFEAAFLDARRGRLEDDGLNALVLSAVLPGREVTILRAIAKYLRQAGIAYSDAYLERTLRGHPDIARLLVKLFLARLHPERPTRDLADRLVRALETAIDGVPSLDEDRILRNFLAVTRATVRTSYFRNESEAPPEYLSFKLEPETIPAVPEPRPRFEIFVYSPRFEGVHLRGGKVARGGIRWSDRPEDFRTEVLGLMKAQMVKNALIVPVGAKGGFVLKRAPRDADELREEAISCYRLYLAGLLDLTDSIRDREVVAPARVARLDDDDPYLVVAADKGTASFSDLANEVATEYEFWLGDAFASGGSRGYDHKQMGITARGAWESVKRHFRELGRDIQSSSSTAVGIGDMSGDVFGNGMLLSSQIKLVAAFDHRYVFIDPDPDPEAGFAERKRLFELQGSSWIDYDPDAISDGGGVHRRNAKSIAITPQAADALGIEAEELSPPELICAILRAPVDLLWNGGIGTYVKAASEANADVDDKANDPLRVDGRELRCRVVGEGGNLGFTQQGRIEYAIAGGPEQSGGRINTDSIDNVGGVNASDHEVNIKILLDGLVEDGELTRDQRNDLLAKMTDAVAEQVRYACYGQAEALSVDRVEAPGMIDVHARLIRRLEQVAGLKRELEFLPSDDELSDRKSEHRGLVSPELAIVMAYCKIHLYGRLLESDLPDDEDLFGDLESCFPEPLRGRYGERMKEHRLRREIVATAMANQLVERTGTTFAFRLAEETGAAPAVLARGYAVAREVFEMPSFWEAVEQLDNEVDAEIQLGLLMEGRRLVERSTRWLIENEPGPLRIADTARRFGPGAELLSRSLPGVLDRGECEAFDRELARLLDAGVPAGVAARVAAMRWLPATFDIVAVATDAEADLQLVMETYFGLASRLELGWLRDRINELPRTNRWESLTRVALRDDLIGIQRSLTAQVLGSAGDDSGAGGAIDAWWGRHEEAVERWLATLADVRASRSYDTTTLPVALRELRGLVS